MKQFVFFCLVCFTIVSCKNNDSAINEIANVTGTYVWTYANTGDEVTTPESSGISRTLIIEQSKVIFIKNDIVINEIAFEYQGYEQGFYRFNLNNMESLTVDDSSLAIVLTNDVLLGGTRSLYQKQ